MNRKDFFKNIETVIDDWKDTSFTFISKNDVPGLDDTNLTYGNGEEKKGIEINTCVLFVDIRNSVQLTKDKQVGTMGKIYSVFTHCVLLAAKEEGGYVRNIIGDRVMVVFPPDQCFTKAVFCAITINHIAGLINKKFDNFELRCGIGIDYGKLNVMKVGIKKKGSENDDNKGLVWVGYPANYASRLTDFANKEFIDIVYKVDGVFYECNFLKSSLLGRDSGYYRKILEYSPEEFAAKVSISDNNHNLVLSSCKQIYSIEKEERKYLYKSILISDKVYQEYAKSKPEANDIKNSWWKKQTRKIRDIDFDVWGANLTWKFD